MNIGQWYTYNGTPSSSTSTHRAGIDVRVVSQNEINNTSLVRVRPWIMKLSGSGFWYYNSQTMTIKANNSSKTTKIQYDFRDATTDVKEYLTSDYPFKRISGSGSLVSGAYVYDFTIKHNDDGTKTIPIYALIPLASSYGVDWEVDIEIDLPDIPRKNTLTYSYTTLDEKINFKVSKASDDFTTTINLSFFKENPATELIGLGNIFNKTNLTNLSYTLTEEQLNSVLSVRKSSNVATAFVSVSTYSGNTLLGSDTYMFNIPIKETPPNVSATFIDTNATTIALTGDSSKIVKYISKPKVTITAQAQQQADISSYSTVWGNSSSTAQETTFSSGIDSNILTVSAKDSRNWVGEEEYDLSSLGKYVEYIKPNFSKFTLSRPESTSNTINADLAGVWFNNSFGITSNTLELKYRYKEKGGEYGSYQTITLTTNENNFSFNSSLGSSFNYQKQYDFEFVLTDKLMSVITTFNVESGESIVRIAETYVTIKGDLNVGGKLSIGGLPIRKATNADALIIENNVSMNNGAYINGLSVAENLTLTGAELIGAKYSSVCPVGSVYISSTNENPSSKLGGNWELIDKEFKAYAGASENFFNPNSNVESQETCLVRSGHSIFVRFKLVNAVAIGDTAIAFGEFDWQAMGFTGIGYGLFELVGGSDGGNAHATARIQASGEMTTTDVIGKTSSATIAVGSTIYWIFSLPIRYTNMLDSFCDKFYWKRTA